MTPVRPSTQRILRIVVVSQWVALALGIIASVIDLGGSPEAYLAGALAALYVIITTALPASTLQRALLLEVVVLFGAVFTMTAVALTGGNDSPYFLLSAMPPVTATVLGGLRIGLATGSLSAALLVAIALAGQTQGLAPALGLALLYLVIVVTVAQIRRLLIEIEQRATELEQATAESEQQLETTNQLLQDLAQATADSDTGPIAIGHTALDAIRSRYPVAASMAVINGDDGPVVVARQGAEPDGAHRHRLPLEVGKGEVGYIMLAHTEPISDQQISEIRAALRPVALSFSNALLLQSIAKNAVREERTRLARELHDEIGPSLASLGLSLDVAMLNSADQRVLTTHLESLRDRVGGLVEEVRSTVSDLRSSSSGSLSTYLDSLPNELDHGIPLVVEVDERRPIRPSLAQDVYGIVGEAVRNAFEHSSADQVTVKGWVDFDRGRIVIEDDGVGFDTRSVPDGRFGMVGMRERAARNGVRLSIVSQGEDGTRVDIEWGEA